MLIVPSHVKKQMYVFLFFLFSSSVKGVWVLFHGHQTPTTGMRLNDRLSFSRIRRVSAWLRTSWRVMFLFTREWWIDGRLIRAWGLLWITVAITETIQTWACSLRAMRGKPKSFVSHALTTCSVQLNRWFLLVTLPSQPDDRVTEPMDYSAATPWDRAVSLSWKTTGGIDVLLLISGPNTEPGGRTDKTGSSHAVPSRGF